MDKMTIALNQLQHALTTTAERIEECKTQGFMFSPEPNVEANNIQKLHTDIDTIYALLRLLNNEYGLGHAVDADKIRALSREYKDFVRTQYKEQKATQ